MIIFGAILLWFIVGFAVVRFTHEPGDWLIMITDTRNTPRTWMAIPSLVLCWVLWPISGWVARHCFYLSITNLPQPKTEDYIFPRDFEGTRGSKIEKLPDGEFLDDYDINSMYWQVIRSLDTHDKKDSE